MPSKTIKERIKKTKKGGTMKDDLSKVLAYDLVHQPIYAGSIMYHKRLVYRCQRDGFYQVISASKGKGKLLVRECDITDNDVELDDEQIINNEGIVIPPEIWQNYLKWCFKNN